MIGRLQQPMLTFFHEPQKVFNARFSSKNEIERNPSDGCKNHEEWELEEHANAFEDKDGGLDDKLVVIKEELLDDSKATISELNAYDDSTATMFLPRINLNANFVKEEV